MTNPKFTPYRIVPNAPPIVRKLFSIANSQKMPRSELSIRSGVAVGNFVNWENGSRPRVDMIDACFQALGYTLTIERLATTTNGKITL